MGLFDFTGLKKSIDQLAGQVSSLKGNLEKLRREREDLTVRAASKEDVISLLCQRIDREAAEYPIDLARQISGFIPGGKTARLGERNFSLGILLPQSSGAGSGMGAASLLRDMTFLFRDEIKAGIESAIKAAPWPENPIRLVDRNKRLAELDEEIAALEAQEANLREIAARSGLRLE